jgi:hypothetical protein
LSLFALLLTLTLDAGAAAPWEGHLVAGSTYVVIGENTGDFLAETFRPPRLRLPHHHAGRVEWLGDVKLPRGKVRVVFTVETVGVQRVDQRRWNSTYTCRVISAEQVP